MAVGVIIYDDQEQERLSRNDLARIERALRHVNAAKAMLERFCPLAAVARVGLALACLGRCDEIGAAWRAAAESVANDARAVLQSAVEP